MSTVLVILSKADNNNCPQLRFRYFASSAHNMQRHFTYWIPGLLQKVITQESPDGRVAEGKI